MKKGLVTIAFVFVALVSKAQDFPIKTLLSFIKQDYTKIENFLINQGYDFIKEDSSYGEMNNFWYQWHYVSKIPLSDTTTGTFFLEPRIFMWWDRKEGKNLNVYTNFNTRMIRKLITKDSYMSYFKEILKDNEFILFNTIRFKRSDGNNIINKIFKNKTKIVELLSATSDDVSKNSYELWVIDLDI